MRNPQTDTPDWRYGTALAELQREDAGIPVYNPCDDALVKVLKTVLPLRMDRAKYLDPEKRLAVESIRAIEQCLKIYEDMSIAGHRDVMEAVLLAPDADIDYFKAHVSPYLTTPIVNLYRKLFYDIDERRDMVFWVQRNLFVPMKHLTGDKFHTAYMWKVVAYHGGTEYLTRFAIDGMDLEDQLRMWLRNMGVSEYVRQVLKSTHSYARLLDGAGTPALPMTANWEKQHDADAGVTEDTAGVAEVMHDTITAINVANEDLVAQKQFLLNPKFSNEDNAK